MNLRTLQTFDIKRAVVSAIQACPHSGYYRGKHSGDNQSDKHNTTANILPDGTIQIHASRSKAESNVIFKARPLFPGSLLSTEVLFLSPENQSIDPSQQTEAIPKGHHHTLDHPVETGLYYRLHDPIPDYLGTQLYRSGQHIAGIFENESSVDKIDAALINEIRLILNDDKPSQSTPDRVQTLFFIDCNATGTSRSKGSERYRSSINIRKFSHFSHRLNVIGKSSLIVCDSAGIAVDAIRSSVPVLFTSVPPTGFEHLQVCVNRFLQHHSLRVLLEEQNLAIDEIVRTQCLKSHVMSNESTLQLWMDTHLAQTDSLHAVNGPTRYKNTGTVQDNLILRSQQQPLVNADKTLRLKSGLQSSRRKFQKFKESPSRFMEDSQSRILRSLIAGKTPK